MSVHVMSWVLRHSEAKLGSRLVLLVLADHAAEDGTQSFPTVATIAREARLSERQAQRCLRSLEESGAIRNLGTRLRGQTEWGVNMSPPGVTSMTAESQEGVTSVTDDGARMSPEPSLQQPSIEKQPSRDTRALARAAYDPLKGTKIGGRNLPWDALVEVTQADERIESGRLGRALKTIRRVCVADALAGTDNSEVMEAFIATEIRLRAQLYRSRWPNVELTPTALAANWTRITRGDGRSGVEALAVAQRAIDDQRSRT